MTPERHRGQYETEFFGQDVVCTGDDYGRRLAVHDLLREGRSAQEGGSSGGAQSLGYYVAHQAERGQLDALSDRQDRRVLRQKRLHGFQELPGLLHGHRVHDVVGIPQC